MMKISEPVEAFLDSVLAHPYVVAAYEEHSLSHIVGPFASFSEATDWNDTYPWREDAYGEVFVLYPPHVT